MGLAPFSTAALKDTLIERDLEIDGTSESVIYVTGCGMPAGKRQRDAGSAPRRARTVAQGLRQRQPRAA
jgi:hypothetical protein